MVTECVAWRQFPNHPLYEVSNTGLVRRKDSGRLRKPVKIKNGYLTIMLTDRGRYELEYVHRAVATAFIPNSKNLPQVNHIDKNKQNNRVENLEWCTAKENVQHSQSRVVYQCDKNGAVINSFSGLREAERKIGAKHGSIGRALLGQYKTAYGYKWRYAE